MEGRGERAQEARPSFRYFSILEFPATISTSKIKKSYGNQIILQVGCRGAGRPCVKTARSPTADDCLGKYVYVCIHTNPYLYTGMIRHAYEL